MKYTKNFIGNAAVYQYLQNQVKNGTVPHANLVVGPDHIGKTALITNILFLLICQKTKADANLRVPCGRCQHCTMLLHDVHPNVVQVSPNDKNSISIAEIRSLVGNLRQSSFLSGKRIIVINQADTMTTAASNALLKILEEPGRDSIFFLSAPAVDSVLPTIQSRCAAIELHPVTSEDLAELEPDNVELLSFANGLPGLLKGLAKGNTKKQLQAHAAVWIQVIQETSLHKRLSIISSIWPDSIKRPKAQDQLDILENISRDILLLQNSLVDNIQNTFARTELQQIATRHSINTTLQSLQSIKVIQQRMRQPVHLKITLTDLLLTIYR